MTVSHSQPVEEGLLFYGVVFEDGDKPKFFYVVFLWSLLIGHVIISAEACANRLNNLLELVAPSSKRER